MFPELLYVRLLTSNQGGERKKVPAFKPLKPIATKSKVKQEVKQEGIRSRKASTSVSRFVRCFRPSTDLFKRSAIVKTEKLDEGRSQVKEEPVVKREPVSRVATSDPQVRRSPLYVVLTYR